MIKRYKVTGKIRLGPGDEIYLDEAVARDLAKLGAIDPKPIPDKKPDKDNGGID